MQAAYKYFTSIEQLRTIDIRRMIYLFTSILAFIFTEVGRYVYRPFIYQNQINDFGLADSMGNTGGIIVQIFFALALLNSNFKQGFRVIGFLVIGFIFYEVLQPILPKGTFDMKDIGGTLLGGLISAVIFVIVQKYNNNNRILTKI